MIITIEIFKKMIRINEQILPPLNSLRVAPGPVDHIFRNDRKGIIPIVENLILCYDSPFSIITVAYFKIIVKMKSILTIICDPSFPRRGST